MATGEIVLKVQITDGLRGAVFVAFHETVDALVVRYLDHVEKQALVDIHTHSVKRLPDERRADAEAVRKFVAWVKATVKDPDDDESGGG